MKIVSVFVSILLIFSFLSVNSQQLKENEIVVIKGEKFVLHQVRTGETLFSISQNFKVDGDILSKHNPKITNGLFIGDVLKIPYIKGASLEEKSVVQKGDPNRFEIHKIKSRRETPYFIAKKYKITVEQLYAYNPLVKKFRRGVKINIPRWDPKPEPVTVVEETEKAEEGNFVEHKVLDGETLYSISKKYNVSESELLFYNPSGRDLKAGSILYIPNIAQIAESMENKGTVDGFFDHIIESGETLYGLSRKYGVNEGDLIALNPVLKTGFPAGAIIRIPANNITATAAKPVNKDVFTQHIVEAGETLYGLAHKYELSIPVLKRFNPALEARNLVAGETILIPLKQEIENIEIEEEEKPDSLYFAEDVYKVRYEAEIPESCKPENSDLFLNTTYDIALFLPLFTEANDTLNRDLSKEILMQDTSYLNAVADTLIEKEIPQSGYARFYRNSENFIQFYEGVLLAVDSMKQAGMNVNLNVFDTNQDVKSIRQYIYAEEFLETDLIIGPVYERLQNEVAEIASKNRIPLVSPLSSKSGIINSNPYYFQIRPSNDYMLQQTADLVAEEYYNSNVIIFRTGFYGGTPEERLVHMIQEKLKNTGFLNQENGSVFSIYDFKEKGIASFESILSTEKENVVFIPSSNEGELSVAISNLSNLTDKYSITLIGLNGYQQKYESIPIIRYHNLKMKIIAPYWVDYKNPEVIRFVDKFKNNFYTEPNAFANQGYDITFYFLNAFKSFGRECYDCLPFNRGNLVHGNYNFRKVSAFGGYINQGISVVSYEKNYDVLRKRVKGHVKLAVEN